MRQTCVLFALAGVALAAPVSAQSLDDGLRPSVNAFAGAAQTGAAGGPAGSGASDTTAPAPPGATPPVAVPELPPEAADVARKPKKKPSEDDPFAAVGTHVGSFILLPALEAETGYGDNLTLVPISPRTGLFGRLTGEAVLRSDWSRHELDISLRGSLDSDSKGEPIFGPTVDAKANGRLDISRTTKLEVSGSYAQGRDTQVLLTLPPGAVDRPETRQSTATATLTQAFGRMSVAVSGLFGRYESEDVQLAGGGVIPGADSAYDTTEGRLRVGYEVSPAVKPFADVYVNRRNYDIPVDPSGTLRGSEGTGTEAGVTFDMHGLLTGEAAVGWQVQHPRDPLTHDLSAVTTRASLVWSPTPLTTVRLRASTGLDETPFASTTLGLVRTYGVDLRQSLRVDLDLVAGASFIKENYADTVEEDRRTRAGIGLVYKANRSLWLKANYAYEQLDSTFPGASYHANIVTVGVRVQR